MIFQLCNDELENNMEVATAYFKILPQHLHVGTEENHDMTQFR